MTSALKRYMSPFMISAGHFRKPSVLVLVFSLCFAFWMVDLWRAYNHDKRENNFSREVMGHYSYLPAYFYSDGVFEFRKELTGHIPVGPYGTMVPDQTYGLAVMYAPFYALAYKIAWNQRSPLDGFSEPFVTCLHWGSILYVILGLFFLRKFLLVYFDEYVTAITLGSLLFGSLLFFYTFVQSELMHGYGFALFCIFLFLTQRWHLNPSSGITCLVGVVAGLVSLINPADLVILILFIFWNVRSSADARAKLSFFRAHYRKLILIFFIGIAMWIPQLVFHRLHTGDYFYFFSARSYAWGDPRLLDVLFSYRNGWITYSPLVALALVGIFFVGKAFPVPRLVLFLTVAISAYVLGCWRDWQYSGGFGARVFCPQMAILSVPLAALLHRVIYQLKKPVPSGAFGLLTLAFLCSCICLTTGLTFHYNISKKMHPSGMTGKVYWKILRQYRFTVEDETRLQEDLKVPDGTSHPGDPGSAP